MNQESTCGIGCLPCCSKTSPKRVHLLRAQWMEDNWDVARHLGTRRRVDHIVVRDVQRWRGSGTQLHGGLLAAVSLEGQAGQGLRIL